MMGASSNLGSQDIHLQDMVSELTSETCVRLITASEGKDPT